jgi:hypothetical protein
VAAPAPSAPAPAGTPAIDFDERAHDFGLVTEGMPIKHTFQVKNPGTAPLVLSEVRTSCGCTAATLGGTTIPPGGSGPLEVTMDTHGQRGPGQRTITVAANDPRQPTSTLEIKYDIQPLLGFDRPFVQLTTTKGKSQVERVGLVGQRVEQARLRVEVKGTKLVSARAFARREASELHKGLEVKLNGKELATGDGTLIIKTGLATPAELSLIFRYEVK